LRGGSWNNSAANCRSAIRNRNRADNRNRNNGFRVALVPGTRVHRSGGGQRTAHVPVVSCGVRCGGVGGRIPSGECGSPPGPAETACGTTKPGSALDERQDGCRRPRSSAVLGGVRPGTTVVLQHESDQSLGKRVQQSRCRVHWHQLPARPAPSIWGKE
jgi:hypothetical protein